MDSKSTKEIHKYLLGGKAGAMHVSIVPLVIIAVNIEGTGCGGSIVFFSAIGAGVWS